MKLFFQMYLRLCLLCVLSGLPITMSCLHTALSSHTSQSPRSKCYSPFKDHCKCYFLHKSFPNNFKQKYSLPVNLPFTTHPCNRLEGRHVWLISTLSKAWNTLQRVKQTLPTAPCRPEEPSECVCVVHRSTPSAFPDILNIWQTRLALCGSLVSHGPHQSLLPPNTTDRAGGQ